MTRTVLVTGASRGIGAAVALRCATAGWDVAVNYTRDAGAAEQVAATVRAAGRAAITVQADVADEAAVLAMFARIDAELPPLTGLVNNAGVVDAMARVYETSLARLPQLVQDARRHGVEVRAIDVSQSDWDCTLERRADGDPHPAVRLGLRLVSTLSQAAAERLTQARRTQGFASVDDLARRAGLDARELQALAQADALQSLAGHRRRQLWAAAGQERIAPDALLANAPIIERAHEQPDLFKATEGEAITLDYAATGLTLRRHPLALLRNRLNHRGWRSAEQLAQLKDGSTAWACGIVTMRQQPETAKGVIFVTLEDETGSVNIIVWRHIRERERQRTALLRSRLLAVAGQWQAKDGSMHLIARRLVDVTPWLGSLATSSRDFH